MILFKEDWDSFPNAIVHETKNESWIEMAVILEKMGIENNLFFLSLMQPELADIDPFSPDLDQETKVKIATECEYNWWYFFREILKVAPQASANPIPFKLNRGNLAMYWCFANHIDFALEQIRQTGKSVSADGLMLGLMYAFARNSTFGLFTKDDGLRRENVERHKKMREFLPSFIYTKHKKDIDNQTEYSNYLKGNHFRTAVGQKSEIAANNSGRGFTMPVQQWDETPFISLVDIAMPAALGSGTAVREEAASNERPYGNIYTTTSGDRDTREGKYTYKFFHEADFFSEVYYDAKNYEELKDMVVSNGKTKKLMLHGVFNHRQLGKSDEWLSQTLADNNATGDAANKDYFLIWPSGNLLNPIKPHILEEIKGSIADPEYQEIERDHNEMYITRWYKNFMELGDYLNTHHLTLGIDTSDAIGRDSISLRYVDIKSLGVMGAMDINETNLFRFGKFLAKMLIKYPNVTVNIEKKSSAQGIIDTLLVELPKAGIDPFRRLFNRVIDDPDNHKEQFKLLQVPFHRRDITVYNQLKKFIGFNTSGDSRHHLYSTTLPNALDKGSRLIRDRTLASELGSLVVKNDRIDHSSSGHDDSVMAYMLAVWLPLYGRNLSWYGIKSEDILSEALSRKKIETDEDLIEAEFQEELKQELEELLLELSEAIDPFKIKSIERKIQMIGREIEDDDISTNSIDQMIKQAEQERKNKYKLQRRYWN